MHLLQASRLNAAADPEESAAADPVKAVKDLGNKVRRAIRVRNRASRAGISRDSAKKARAKAKEASKKLDGLKPLKSSPKVWKKLGINKNKSHDYTAFLCAVALHCGIMIGAILFISLVRGKYRMVYAKNVWNNWGNSQEEERAELIDGKWVEQPEAEANWPTENSCEQELPARPPSSSRFGWVLATFSLKNDQIMAGVGLDQAMLIEFTNLGMRTFACIGIPMCLFIAPVHMFLGGGAAGDDMLSWQGFANVERGNGLVCWLHAIIVWMVVLLVDGNIYQAQEQFVKRRVEWLHAGPRLVGCTILVEGIPPRMSTRRLVQQFFNDAFPGGGEVVDEVHMLTHTEKIESLIALRNSTKITYDSAKIEQKKLDCTGELYHDLLTGKDLTELGDDLRALDADVKKERQRLLDAMDELDHKHHHRRSDSDSSSSASTSESESGSSPLPTDRSEVDATSSGLPHGTSSEGAGVMSILRPISSPLLDVPSIEVTRQATVREDDPSPTEAEGSQEARFETYPQESSPSRASLLFKQLGHLCNKETSPGRMDALRGDALPQEARGVTRERLEAPGVDSTGVDASDMLLRQSTEERSAVSERSSSKDRSSSKKPAASSEKPKVLDTMSERVSQFGGSAAKGFKKLGKFGRNMGFNNILKPMNQMTELEEDILKLYCPSAFVTFKTRFAAIMASRLTPYTPNKQEWIVSLAPDPGDIRYEDFKQNKSYEKIFEILGYVLIFALVLVFLPTIGFISSISNLEAVGEWWPAIEVFAAQNPKFAQLWNGVAGALGLNIMLSFLPTVLMFISGACFKLKFTSMQQLHLQRWYFIFLILFQLLVVSITSSLPYAMKRYIENPLSFVRGLSEGMCRTTHFFLSIFVLQWSTTGLESMRYVQIFKYMGWRKFGCDPEEAAEAAEPEDQDYYGIGARSARYASLFVCGVAFVSLCPIISIVAFINFFVIRLLIGYSVVFAETIKPDLGGEFWVVMLKQCQVGLIIYIVGMSGVLMERASTILPGFIAGSAVIYMIESIFVFDNRFHWKGMSHKEVCATQENDEKEMRHDPNLHLHARKATRPTYQQKELSDQCATHGDGSGLCGAACASSRMRADGTLRRTPSMQPSPLHSFISQP